MKYVFLLLFGLLYFPINAQVDVNIVFNTDKVNNIEVWVYDNFITGSKHLAFTADRNFKASHKKQIDLQQTGKIIVKTVSTEQWFYVQPAYEYTIIISAKSIDIESEDNTNELMKNIDKLQVEYRQANTKWPSGDSKKSFVPAMQELLAKLDSLPSQNTYFDKLLTYKIASIKYTIAQESRDKIYTKKIEKKYLTETIVDYTNPLQINFIAQFYYWKSTLLYLRDTPNTSDPYKSFFNELALSKNDTVKQIATLYFIRKAALSYWGGGQAYTNNLLDSLHKNAVNNILEIIT